MEPEASPATTCWKNSAISVAEVGLADGFVLDELGARALERDASDLQHIRAARRAQRELRVLLDDEHREALLLVQLGDDLEQLTDDQRREAERRLVEQEQARP